MVDDFSLSDERGVIFVLMLYEDWRLFWASAMVGLASGDLAI